MTREFAVTSFEYGNAQHIGRRQEQQDSFGFSDPTDFGFADHGGFLAVVADGMGGLSHGDAASRLAVREFLAAYREKTAAESIPVALHRSAMRANVAVCLIGDGESLPDDIGTTLAAAVVLENTLHWISVGDSAVLLYRDGAFTQLNTPHTYAVHLDREATRGTISQEAAHDDPQREALVSYLGARDLRELDRAIRPFPLRAGDRVLLASDGLFKALAPDEMAAAMRGGLQDSCESLVAAAVNKALDDQDNITVVALSGAAGGDAFAPVALPRSVHSRLKTRVPWFVLPVVVALGVGSTYWFRPPRGDGDAGAAQPHIAPLPGGARLNIEKSLPSWQQRGTPETGEAGSTRLPASRRLSDAPGK
jgi:protein phosphatase